MIIGVNVSIYIPKIEKFSHSISHQTLFSYIVKNIFISFKHKQCKYWMKKISSKLKLQSFSEADRPSLLIASSIQNYMKLDKLIYLKCTLFSQIDYFELKICIIVIFVRRKNKSYLFFQ